MNPERLTFILRTIMYVLAVFLLLKGINILNNIQNQMLYTANMTTKIVEPLQDLVQVMTPQQHRPETWSEWVYNHGYILIGSAVTMIIVGTIKDGIVWSICKTWTGTRNWWTNNSSYCNT